MLLILRNQHNLNQQQKIIKPNTIWFHHIFIENPFLNKPFRRSRKVSDPVLHPVILIVYYQNGVDFFINII